MRRFLDERWIVPGDPAAAVRLLIGRCAQDSSKAADLLVGIRILIDLFGYENLHREMLGIMEDEDQPEPG